MRLSCRITLDFRGAIINSDSLLLRQTELLGAAIF
jgi:hypothetical protein